MKRKDKNSCYHINHMLINGYTLLWIMAIDYDGDNFESGSDRSASSCLGVVNKIVVVVKLISLLLL